MNMLDVLGRPPFLGKPFVSEDEKRRFTIFGKGTNYVSKRVIQYETSLGSNSAGTEIEYERWNDAMKYELEWLNTLSGIAERNG